MNRHFTIITLCVLSCFISSCGVANKANRQEGAEDFYFMEGLRQFHDRNYVYAERSFKQLLSINPQHDAALYYLANIKFEQGKKEEALDYLQAASLADTLNYWYQLQIAQLYKMNQEIELSIQLYDRLLARYPHKSDLYFELANLYLSQRDTEKALILLDEIEKFMGVTEATGFYRVNMLLMLEREEEALPYLEELALSYPSPRILVILGDLYAGSGKDSIALVCYTQALTQEPDYIPAIFGQAEIFRLSQQYDLYFEKMALFMSDPFVEAEMKVDYMEQLLQSRSFVVTFLKQVDTLYSKLYLCHQADTAVVYRYAGFLVQAGREERAVDILKLNVERHPQSLSSWYQYLALNNYLQRWETMATVSKEALHHFPNQPDIMTMQGIAAWQTDHIPEAISIFESVLSRVRNNIDLLTQTWSILGDLYYALGKPEKSFQAYEKSLKLNSNLSGTLNNYAYYLSLEGKKLEKAYEMSKKTIESEPQNTTYLDTFGWILYKLGRYQEAKAIFKQVLIYENDLSAEVLDHYAEVLFALKEYDMAFIYWDKAKYKEKNPELEKKIEERKTQRIK